MDFSKIFWIHNSMNQNKFLMCYNGNVSHQLLKSLLSITEKKLMVEETDINVRKKVFHVMLECLHAVCNSKVNHEDCMILLGRNTSNYEVIMGLMINGKHLEFLKSLMKQVDESFENNTLKELHKDLLNRSQNSNVNTTLFSLIDIAIKSRNKIEYDFIPQNDQYFMSLKTKINPS